MEKVTLKLQQFRRYTNQFDTERYKKLREEGYSLIYIWKGQFSKVWYNGFGGGASKYKPFPPQYSLEGYTTGTYIISDVDLETLLQLAK